MEMELEPRVKPLPYKIKGMSRESPSQKATHVLDTDLRTHWSTGTNTKEWILLELDEPCLLSQIRIYNKSVSEWEIAVGLRYKPETFNKVRPRCEAPRRDMMYPMNYIPCRYVRISCLRGNPIAIFFIELIGVSVAGLEPEFQPVVNHLLPHIVSHKQDAHDMHLQLLKDLTNRLVAFLPQLEEDLSSFSDAVEPNIRFLAMLAGPFYPILHIVNERQTARLAGNIVESEASKNSVSSSALTVSSNFEPRRSRNTSLFLFPTSSSLVFRPDAVFMLLRRAYKDSHLGTVCRLASRILLKLIEPITVQESSVSSTEVLSSVSDEASKSELPNPVVFIDYSSLFGDEFRIPDGHLDSNYLNILDIAAVEEGVLHVLYACASQPLYCSKLADSTSDFWSALPLVQALLPALRPYVSSSDHVDDNFSQWKQPFVQHALSQIVATSSSPVYHPLLRACAGYLSSFSPSHAKAACLLIDLCSGVLAPWMGQVIAKVDLTLELIEDFLGAIQVRSDSKDIGPPFWCELGILKNTLFEDVDVANTLLALNPTQLKKLIKWSQLTAFGPKFKGARLSLTRARAALKCIILALSGHMDDIMAKFKELKHRILFLVEMLEPFLDPAMTPIKQMIAFGNVSSVFREKQEQTCAIAINVIRTAVKKPAVLPSLETEWRRGSVAPSVLLSILEPHMQLPPEIDFRKFPLSQPVDQDPLIDGKTNVPESTAKMDVFDDISLLFAPPELRNLALSNISSSPDRKSLESSHVNVGVEEKHVENNFNTHIPNGIVLDPGYPVEYSNLHVDYLHLMNYRDCELRASEFRHLALDLHSQHELSAEGHDAAIDALLLAAECYVNPFFMLSFKDTPKVVKTSGNLEFAELRRILEKNNNELETVAYLERKRDKVVLQILLEAAELDRKYQKTLSDEELFLSYADEVEEVINLSRKDIVSVDAITLVRQNQLLLCEFLIQRLQRDPQSMHEILMQSLLYFLHSATKLSCPPENVVNIIIRSAEYLNGLLTSLYYQFKEGSLPLDRRRVHEVQRRWMLLQRLVVASSGCDEGPDFSVNGNNGFRFANLIPPSAWMQKVSTFSSSAVPLVRFLGWMGVSRNAKQYVKERLFLASDLSQLTYLLSIFADELACVDNIVEHKDQNKKIQHTEVKQENGDQSFHSIYPEISHFLPNMKKQFEDFGEIILEAVGLQLRSLSASVVPDLLCWFSDLCSWPFLQKEDPLSIHSNSDNFKGFVVKNAKAVILYTLDAIVTEHMEAMVPEIPRVIQVLISLCRSSYCDVSFLDSILRLLKPIISYSLRKVSDEEKLLTDDACLNFESLCFDELFSNIRHINENHGRPAEKVYSRALTIFILASVFPDLSFERKRLTLQSLIFWADFATFEPTTSFHDYLCAFDTVMESCKSLLVETLGVFGAIPLTMPLSSDANNNNNSESGSLFLSDIFRSSLRTEEFEKQESDNGDTVVSHQNVHLTTDEMENFSMDFEGLISKLNLTIELCWNIHHQLTKKLTLVIADCYAYSRCLSSIAQQVSISARFENESLVPSNSFDQFEVHWKIGLEGVAEMIGVLQENHCWEVASTMLDCLLGVPRYFRLDNVITTICSTIKKCLCCAPKIAWRLQTDKWLSFLFSRGIHSLHESEIPLVDLLCAMLGHPEPEQRFIALRHLGKFVGQDVSDGMGLLSPTTQDNLISLELILSPLVLSTWDRVAVLASSDTSLFLRTRAMALLVDYIPFAERRQLQSFLAAADSVLHGLGKLGHHTWEGPFTLISLALIASICLHSPAEDISLIPQNVWRNIETLGMSHNEVRSGDLEKKACQALCRLKNEGDEAKEILREVLFSRSSKQLDPDFGSIRESVLQVLANLTSVQSYFDFFSNRAEQNVMELDEAEIEMDLLQREQALQESSNDLKNWCQLPIVAAYTKDDNRLQQIKDAIRSLEKSKLREEIVAHRQKKLLVRRSRQKYLEEAALREAEFLQELDRERTTEVEREIERQRLLELERAKTRELRHNLELEKEKQTQRELQRELEQVESGLRPSRREFSSSTHSSRPRDRYRERENGRSGNEGSLRTSSGNLQSDTVPANSTISLPVPTVILSGSRPLPTILQSRDRADDCGSSYEENFDGSKDSGDTGSVGDPELVSTFEGQSGGFGSGQRHGSRGSKSRQIMERRDRERDGRREGKWERKH